MNLLWFFIIIKTHSTVVVQNFTLTCTRCTLFIYSRFLTLRFENKMVASAIFITDTKGKVIIARNYRGDIPMAASEK